jgi:NADPH2:quinone reductase
MMKAIRVHEFGGPEVLKLEDVPDLQAGPGQVVVRVKAVGVNPVRHYMRLGTYAIKPPLPYTPGSDAAGIVDSVGEGVVGFAPGDRVYVGGTLTGAYAEQTLAEAWQVHPLPPNVTFAQGAGVTFPTPRPSAPCSRLRTPRPAETVLIHGASGGVGVAGVQLARAAGLTVIGTGGTERGRRLVAVQGAHHVLDHHAPGYLDELMKLTGGRGVDVILEMLANVNLAKDLTVLAPKGRVVVIGNRGNIEINPREIMRRDAAVLGLCCGTPAGRNWRAFTRESWPGSKTDRCARWWEKNFPWQRRPRPTAPSWNPAPTEKSCWCLERKNKMNHQDPRAPRETIQSFTVEKGRTNGFSDIRRVQIMVRPLNGDLRLRRLLCGKAPPFRRGKPPLNLLRAPGRHSLPAARRKRKRARWAGKAEPFRTAAGRSPVKCPERSLIWTAV